MKTDWESPLDIPRGKRGNFSIEHVKKPSGWKASTANLRCRMFTDQEHMEIEFPHETRWHRLLEEGSVWMSDYPIEQAQHDHLLKPVHGSVLVGGLGIGYAAQTLAYRDEVHEIVIVEKSKEVIDLVSPYINDPGNKIQFEHMDLFDSIKTYHDEPSFDWAFYDIWASDSENTFHQIVHPLREESIANHIVHHDARIICWNEDVMRGQLSQSLRMRILTMGLTDDGPEVVAIVGNSIPVPSVEDLCKIRHDIWADWTVPFWKKVRDIPNLNVLEAAKHYAWTYGRWEWENMWNDICDNGILRKGGE